MKLTIKTIRQEIFEIIADENETILEVKKKLQEASNQQLPYEKICLIYRGAVLDNDKTLSAYKIDENKFLVALVLQKIPETKNSDQQETDKLSDPLTAINKIETKKSEQNEDQPTTSRSSEPLTAPNETETKNSEKDSTNKDQSIPSTPSDETETDEQGATCISFQNLTDPVDIEKAINNIVTDMGYCRAEVEEAFKITSNNPFIAVEYLFGGILANPMTQRIQTNPENNEVSPESEENFDESSVNIKCIKKSSKSLQKRFAEPYPNSLSRIIYKIAEPNIRYLQLIRDNQEDFVNMINEPASTTCDLNNNDENYIEIKMSPDDLLSIERLQQLGFSEINCIKAFFACQKHEDIAAHYLSTYFYKNN